MAIEGVWGLSESIKKGKFVTKILFSDVVWSSKNYWKMISADVKKEQEIKDLVAGS